MGAKAATSRAAGVGWPFGVLSPRQLECLQLVCAGMSRGQAARRLFIVPGTLGNHMADIRRLIAAEMDEPACPTAGLCHMLGRAEMRRELTGAG